MTEKALNTRRQYYRNWYINNKEKMKEYQKRYWEKKARTEKEGVTDGE